MGNVAVYKKGTTDFFSQGLGLLSDVVSSNLTQTVSSTGNVEQKLEVEYPIDGYLVSELVEGAILRVSVSTDKSDYGVFEIVDTLKDDSGTITVYGDPYYNRILRMSFDNGGVFTKFSSVQSALNSAKQNITGFPADFNLISNLNTSVDLSENTYDTFGTFLEALNSAVHGNIKYSLNSIQIYSALGKDITDITLRDDMNTSSVKITTDFSGIINKVIPVLPVLDKDGNATDQTKVGTIVTSKYSNQFLDYWAGKVIQFDTQDLANTYFDRTNADRPVQTVEVDPIGLDDDFSTINIFDTIELYSTRLDYTDKLRVSERVFDTLAENVTSFKLGSSSVNIFNQINEQNNEIFNNVVKLTNAVISANGKGIDYFGQAQPASPKEGDTWFWDDGTDFGIKQYTNGEWVDLAGSNTAEKIAAGVTEAVAQAKAHTDEVKQGLSTDITTAKSQAASQASTAEANAKSAATSQFTQAQSALSAAKTDLTTSINNEATDRQKAITDLDAKATNAVNQAKSDINDTINAISVGGRNLLLNSNDFAKTPNWSLGTEWNIGGELSKDTYQGLSVIQTNIAWGGPKYNNSALENQGVIQSVSDTFIMSAWVRNTGTTPNDIYFMSNSTSNESYKVVTLVANSGWVRINTEPFHFTKTSGLTGTQRFEPTADSTDGYIQQAGLKLEKGNIATDWTPAPEDVVLDYTTKDNQIKETITQYKDTNDGKVSKAQTDATTALGLVETKVSKTDYNTKTGELTKSISDVKQTADSYAQVIADIHTADGKQDARMSEIENTASGLKSTVSDLSTTQGKQSGYISTLQQRADGFDATVTKVNNMSVGGRNLYTDTKNFDNLASWYTLVPGSWTKTTDSYNGLAVIQTIKDWFGISQYIPVKKGDVLTYSVYAKYTSGTGTSKIYWALNNQTEGSYSMATTNPSDNSVTITDSWQRVSGTTVATSDGYLRPRLERTDNNTNTLQIAGIKVEKGNVATDWSPAPEDVDSSISSVKQTAVEASTAITNYKTSNDGRVSLAEGAIKTNADAITQKVSQTDYDKKTGDLTTAVNTAQSTANSAVTTIGNYQTSNDARVKATETSIAQNANDITLRATTDDLNSAKSDLNSSISQVKVTADSISNFVRDSSGNISSDFQTALSRTSIITGSTLATSIQTQTSSQITSALTDNNGKIISLINQDTSGVQIVGKNIVLDGDTTVTGSFKVSQVNIANGAIGTAQIGDAAITDAKIANLDVSKITGNVTNFIQSYWNGVYGSTTMNANGLSVQSGSMTTLFDSSGAHFAQGTRTAQYSFGNWIDNTGTATSAVGLYMGLRGDNNSFLDIIGPSGAAVAVIAGSDMADGANTNNVRGAINLFADTNIRSKLLFKGNDTVTSTYIEADEIRRTMNFYTDNAKNGDGNWFWFNHKVLSTGTFSSTSLLSKKNVIADYEEDALSEISKTDIVEFEYKNDVGEKHISPIIDDVNDEKDYYIPKTILGENNQYVDMYSMISMAWKAIKQLSEKIGDK